MKLQGSFGFGSAGASPAAVIVAGAGTPPKMPVWTAAQTIGNSQVSDNGTTVFIGAAATSTKAFFEVNSTTKGVLFPRMTTVQRDAIVTAATEHSLFIFNTTLDQYQYWNDTAATWETIDNGLNGIYSGSGVIPAATQAIITDTFTFTGGDLISKGKNSVLNNTSLGIGIFSATVNGQHNTGVGYFPLFRLTTGTRNTGIGSQVLYNNIDGSDNTCFGYIAGYSVIGTGNTIIGSQAARATTGSSNVIIGSFAGYYETGSNQLFIDNNIRGSEALGRTNSLIYGTFSTTVASQTLRFNAKVGINVVPTARLHVHGEGATSATTSLLVENSTSNQILQVRDDGMVSATDGYSINGTLFLHNTFGGIQDANKNNTFLGLMTPTAAGGAGSAGTKNTAIGSVSMQTLTTGYSNTAVGHGSLNKITIGRDNVAIGQYALFSLTSAIQSNESYNTAIGKESFSNLLTGAFNVGLGLQSGANITSGAGNTCLGYLAGASSSGTYNNSIAIGRNAQFNASNQMVVGSKSGGTYIAEVIWGEGIEAVAINPTTFTQKITNISAGNLDVSTQYDFVFQSSAGTGAGLGGKFIFKVAPATVTGTTQNAFVDAMTIQQDGFVGVGVSAPTSKFTVNGDVESLLNTSGFIVLDRTNGNRYRIYTDGGVLNTELVL